MLKDQKQLTELPAYELEHQPHAEVLVDEPVVDQVVVTEQAPVVKSETIVSRENQAEQVSVEKYEQVVRQAKESFERLKAELAEKTQAQTEKLKGPDNANKVKALKEQITKNLKGSFRTTFRTRHGRLERVRHGMLDLEILKNDFRIEQTGIHHLAKNFFNDLMTDDNRKAGELRLSDINLSQLALSSSETENLANEIVGLKAELSDWLKQYERGERDQAEIDEHTYTKTEMDEFTVGMRELVS